MKDVWRTGYVKKNIDAEGTLLNLTKNKSQINIIMFHCVEIYCVKDGVCKI